MDYWHMVSIFRGPLTGVTIGYYPKKAIALSHREAARRRTRQTTSAKPTIPSSAPAAIFVKE
jgi:hypothetical protein